MTPKRGTLTEAEIREAAKDLGCHPAALAAVAEVESGPRGAFDSEGRPTILYERHVFHRLTQGRYDDAVLMVDSRRYLLSSPDPGGYGLYSHQYLKLWEAERMDHEAARKSCSWGLFQIMGENFHEAGFSGVNGMADRLNENLGWHLFAFASFIRSTRPAHLALQHGNWPGFAFAYNGPGFRKNKYDEKMRAAYARLSETTYKEA